MIKFATFHLLIINEAKYIDAACMSAYSYRKYGNESIEHNCMIDSSITPQGIKKLHRFFDNVFLIPLVSIQSDFKISTEKLKERYGQWVDYALTKWYILNFDQYKKVLLCDVDTLAVSNYTNIFEIRPPAWCAFHKSSLNDARLRSIIKNSKTNDVIDSNYMKTYTGKSLQNICDLNCKNRRFFIPVNGSIVLLKPSVDTFNDLIKFIKSKSHFKMLSTLSFPDENALFEYYICYKKQKVHILGVEYLITPWLYIEESSVFYDIKKPVILNYDSTNKPWLKEEKDLYPEEQIWYDLRKKLDL